MKHNEVRIKTCPRCSKIYSGVPALSKADGKTFLCPDCGTREALESIGVKADEQMSRRKFCKQYTVA